MTQVNDVRNEWGYPNSARALSESAVRARAGPGRFGALSAVQRRCVGGNLRWSRIAPANPVRAVGAWCGPWVRGLCRADHVRGPCRAGAMQTGPGQAGPVQGRALYIP